MMQVRIAGLSLDDNTEQPMLLLVPAADDGSAHGARRALPIWIGHAEATAILLALQGVEPPRPMTHDLMKAVLETVGFAVSRVEITRLEGGTFYAALVLRGEERELAIDARPSDSIALAVRFGCPVFVAEDVFDEAAVEVTEVDEEEEVEAFRDFLEHVDPNDFMS
ncbi:MAG: bifunctional nuclease family protein [Actinobacteria bacterium]|nr:bifunctional nuclease family protein [Actinomycetota bacterium]